MTEYYVCSLDIIPFLRNKRYTYVYYFTSVFDNDNRKQVNIMLEHDTNIDRLILVENLEDLTKEELVLLTLKCKVFDNVTTDKFSAYLNYVIVGTIYHKWCYADGMSTINSNI